MKLSTHIFDKKCKLPELKEELNKFTRTNKNKKELILDRDAINSYLNQIQNYNYNQFNFKDKIVQLNPEQYTIVTADKNKHMRIIACAGSGKTTTILCRIRFLVDSNIEPRKILLMSFNVDACQQLRNKITELFGFSPNIDICTIDSFACRHYNMYKNDMGIDYNASISEFCSIVAKFMKTDAGTKITCKYKYVFFDEFQDANQDQFDIIKEFSKNGCVVTVIGDDAQNIYTFRGTNVAYIMKFDKYIDNVATYMLTKNYRSTPEIINMANEVIRLNDDQIKKDMFPVNKSNDIRPKIILFTEYNNEYKYIVNDILTSLNKGTKLDDIAILSRNKEPLKSIEEYIYKHNRDKPTDSINLVALISDEKADTKPQIQPNHITLTTIHKSKGLEWKKVYLIDCGDRFFPTETDNISIQEERRLFYVAVTRAKDELIMPISSKSFPITRFVSEIPSRLYSIDNRTDVKTEDVFKFTNSSSNKLDYSVTEVVRMFRSDDISVLRERGILPKCFPEVETIYDNTYEHNKNVNRYYLHADFGEFIDRYITRNIMEKDKNLISFDDSQANIAICSIIEPKQWVELYRKYLFPLLRNYDLIENKSDVITNPEKYANHLDTRINDNNIDKCDQQILGYLMTKIFSKSKRFKVLPHKIPIVPHGYLPNEFNTQMEEAYKSYNDTTKKTNNVLLDIYNISLCGNITDKRRRLLYKNVFKDFTDDHMKMLEDILLYTGRYSDKKFICKKRVSKLWLDSEISLSGEIDLLNIDDSVVVDYKCSTESSDINIEWIIQMLLYTSLLNDQYAVKELEIFNPMLGKIYRYPLLDWSKGKELIDFAYSIILRNRKEKVINFIEYT